MSGLEDLSDLQTPGAFQGLITCDPSLTVPEAMLYGAASDFLGADVVQQIATAGQRRVPFAAIAHAHHHLMADQPVALATGIEAMFEAIRPS